MKNRLKKAGLSALKLKLKALKLSSVAFIAFLALTVVNIYAPQIEEAYVRSAVGTEVVKMIGTRGTGTGFYVKYKNANVIVTNRHVCKLASANGDMGVQSNGITKSRKVLFISSRADLCVVEGDGGTHGLTIASDDFTVGQKSYTVGHPSGQPQTVSYGFYIGKTAIYLVEPIPTRIGNQIVLLPGYVRYNTTQIHGYSRPGSSGSPITNISGEVTAVLFAGNRGDNNATFAVPLSELKLLFVQYASK